MLFQGSKHADMSMLSPVSVGRGYWQVFYTLRSAENGVGAMERLKEGTIEWFPSRSTFTMSTQGLRAHHSRLCWCRDWPVRICDLVNCCRADGSYV